MLQSVFNVSLCQLIYLEWSDYSPIKQLVLITNLSSMSTDIATWKHSRKRPSGKGHMRPYSHTKCSGFHRRGQLLQLQATRWRLISQCLNSMVNCLAKIDILLLRMTVEEILSEVCISESKLSWAIWTMMWHSQTTWKHHSHCRVWIAWYRMELVRCWNFLGQRLFMSSLCQSCLSWIAPLYKMI